MADAPGQARTTVGQGAQYVTILMGANDRTYDFAFTRPMVSKLDYFHPSLSGQATLSALTWQTSWWGS